MFLTLLGQKFPIMELDDVFAEKEKIALAIKTELSDTMRQFGFDFIKANLLPTLIPTRRLKIQ